MSELTIALAQINVTVGALKDNARHIVEIAREAVSQGASVVVFPELALSGYPPEDLLLKPHFVADCEKEVDWLAGELPRETTVLLGTPRHGQEQPFNTATILSGGKVAGSYHKMLLPNYGVFDEKRVLSPGVRSMAIRMGDARLGVHVCEDSWYLDQAPCENLRPAGLHALLNLSSSPFHYAKLEQREDVLRALAQKLNVHIFYCNLVGGQDELVFDGASKVISPTGGVVARAKQFEEDILCHTLSIAELTTPPSEPGSSVIDWIDLPAPDVKASAQRLRVEPALDDLPEIYAALKVGTHDYVAKNGFEKVVVAISGGIDSALVAAIATDALGPDRVIGITMPSQYSSEGTLTDAGRLAENLNMELKTVPIRTLFDGYLAELSPQWDGIAPDTTEENLQARIRGNIIMAFSNKFGWLVLTTGNKSEMATGYCTLYGDMVGGFAVIKDVPKTMVFELCAWRNQQGTEPVVPRSIIERPPSAELRPDQQDSDSLPPYELLDAILELYVEQDRSAAEIVTEGFDEKTVLRVIRLVDINEYKRRQGAPGIKITPKAFGRDRRLPITNRYRDKV